MRRRWLLTVVVVSFGLAACSDDGGRAGRSVPPTSTTNPGSAGSTTAGAVTIAPPPGLASARVKLTRIATIEQPLAMATRKGDDVLYVAEKTGRVRALRRTRSPGGLSGTEVDPVPVLDLRGRISQGGEQGLLGLAFSPDGSKLYVNFTDGSGDTNVAEYRFADGRADPASERQVLFVKQPFANHNGGNLVFGPDSYLWIGLGDGGSQGDPNDNGQSLGTFLGKILRIDPTPSGARPYTVPPDNPFVGQDGALPEIWALGLRNPWRYSFDRTTGDLWIGDVGAVEREEVDFTAGGSKGGQNYGWARLEGTRRQSGSPPKGAVAPVAENSHADGNCSMTGGYVYRGTQIPDLAGAYLYGDYCLGQVQGLVLAGGKATAQRNLGLEVSSLSSFGQDTAGELYALSLEGPVYRIDPA